MPLEQPEFLERLAPVVAGIDLVGCALNVGAAFWAWRRASRPQAAFWLILAALFAVLGAMALAGNPLMLPDAFKAAANAVLGPVALTVGWLVGLVLLYLLRRWFAIPAVAWTIFNLSWVWLAASMTDPAFAAVVGKPDNLPIVAMLYLLGFFTWLGTAQAVKNDDRRARGLGPVEQDYADTVLVWPDVVYLELIGAVVASVVLIVWSLLVRAPLEQPADPVLTPNPSKAPWYFLGFQEMLVYFPPWLAGVTIPTLIIFGLMAIPYIDVNRKGSGYYTINQRRFAYLGFQFGFLQLWVLLIVIGVFLRGPNWNFFGPYESHDPHKVVASVNVSLAEYFWQGLLGRSLPEVAQGSGTMAELGAIAYREGPGLAALAVYFVLLPLVLRKTVFRRIGRAMGPGRYVVMSLLLLAMFSLPLKMVLNWTLHLNYIVSIPEYFLYF